MIDVEVLENKNYGLLFQSLIHVVVVVVVVKKTPQKK
jgi:hypothetical protein